MRVFDGMVKNEEYTTTKVDWLELVPKGWSICKIKNYVEVFNGDSLTDRQKSKYESDNQSYLPYISSKDINVNTEKINYQSGLRIPKGDGYKVCPQNTTLMCIEGGSAGKKVGFTNQQVCFVNKLACFITSKEIDSSYLHYFLSSSAFKSQFNRSMAGLIGGVAISTIRNFGMILPPLAEQVKIKTFLNKELSSVIKSIENKEKQVNLLREYKQSITQEAVTKGLDPSVPMKDSGVEWIGNAPAHWDVKRIKSMTQVRRGASPRPIAHPKYFSERGMYSWVRIADVSANTHYLRVTQQRLSKLGASLSVKLEPGSLFLSIAGSVGKPMITKIRCCIHDGFVYFPNYQGNTEYLYRVFETGLAFAGLGKHGTQLNLNTDTVGNIYVPHPSVAEKIEIISFINRKEQKVNVLIDLLDSQIQKLRELKVTLINSAVTGKIKII